MTLYFNNKLLRGNRSTKMNSASFDAFDSPNMTPLATVGVDVTGELAGKTHPMHMVVYMFVP